MAERVAWQPGQLATRNEAWKRAVKESEKRNPYNHSSAVTSKPLIQRPLSTTTPPSHSQTSDPNTSNESFLQAVAAVCPAPYRLGIDICKIDRVNRIINRDKASYRKFSSRVLTLIELRLHDEEKCATAEFLAGRWAAKEAVIKAMRAKTDVDSGRKTYMHDIVILPAAILEAVNILDVDNGVFTMKPAHNLAAAQLKKGPVRAFVRSGLDERSNSWQEVIISISHDGGNALGAAFVKCDTPRESSGVSGAGQADKPIGDPLISPSNAIA